MGARPESKATLTSTLVIMPERINFDVPLHKVALTCGSCSSKILTKRNSVITSSFVYVVQSSEQKKVTLGTLPWSLGY